MFLSFEINKTQINLSFGEVQQIVECLPGRVMVKAPDSNSFVSGLRPSSGAEWICTSDETAV